MNEPPAPHAMSANRFAAGDPIWINRQEPLPGGRWRVTVFVGGHHLDGEKVTGAIDTSESFPLCRGAVDEQQRPVLWVNPEATPGAPKLWFVALPDKGPSPATMTLVGYHHQCLQEGLVIDDPTFFHLPVRSDEQVGAIRWRTADGVVDQVYVGEHWRRRHLATTLLYAAGAYHQLHDWPGVLRSDGRRTSAGEHWVAGLRHPQRIAPLTDPMPPMDRDDE